MAYSSHVEMMPLWVEAGGVTEVVVGDDAVVGVDVGISLLATPTQYASSSHRALQSSEDCVSILLSDQI